MDKMGQFVLLGLTSPSQLGDDLRVQLDTFAAGCPGFGVDEADGDLAAWRTAAVERGVLGLARGRMRATSMEWHQEMVNEVAGGLRVRLSITVDKLERLVYQRRVVPQVPKPAAKPAGAAAPKPPSKGVLARGRALSAGQRLVGVPEHE